MPQIPIYYGFNVNSAEPIDSRMTVANEAGRLTIPTSQTYEGMIAYARAEDSLWMLTGANSTLAASWTRIASVGGTGGCETWCIVGNTDIIPESRLPAGFGGVNITVLTATGQTIGDDDLAYVTATEIYQNISGADIAGVTNTTDLSDTTNWLRIGADVGDADSVTITVLSATSQNIAVNGLAYVSATEIYQNISSSIQAAVLTTDFSSATTWLRIGAAPAGGVSITQVDTTLRDIPEDAIVYVSATELYQNISGAAINNVTSSTDFTTSDWLRIGEDTDGSTAAGITITVLTATAQSIPENGLAYLNSEAVYQNVSSAAINTTLTTDFDTTDWIRIGSDAYELTRANVHSAIGTGENILSRGQWVTNAGSGSTPNSNGSYVFATNASGSTISIAAGASIRNISRIVLYHNDTSGFDYADIFSAGVTNGSPIRITDGTASAAFRISGSTWDATNNVVTLAISEVVSGGGNFTAGGTWTIYWKNSELDLVDGDYILNNTIDTNKIINNTLSPLDVSSNPQTAPNNSVLGIGTNPNQFEWKFDTGVTTVELTSTGQSVPRQAIAYISNKESYINTGTAAKASITTATDFSADSDWIRIGVSTNGISQVDLTETGQSVGVGYLAVASNDAAYINQSGAAVTGVTTSTDFAGDPDTWLQVVGGGVTFGTGVGQIATWAEGNNTDDIPLDKIPNTLSNTAFVEATYTDGSDAFANAAGEIYLQKSVSGSLTRLESTDSLTDIRQINLNVAGSDRDIESSLDAMIAGSYIKISSSNALGTATDEIVWRLAATPASTGSGSARSFQIAVPTTPVEDGPALGVGYTQGDTITVEVRPEPELLVATHDILDGAVTIQKIRDGAVSGSKINDNQISPRHLQGITETNRVIPIVNASGTAFSEISIPTLAASTSTDRLIRITTNVTGDYSYSLVEGSSGTGFTTIVRPANATDPAVDVENNEVLYISASAWFLNISGSTISVNSAYNPASVTNAPSWRRYASSGTGVQLLQSGNEIGDGSNAAVIDFQGGDAIRITASSDDESNVVNVIDVNAIPSDQREIWRVNFSGTRTNATDQDGNTVMRIFLPGEIETPGTSGTYNLTFDPNANPIGQFSSATDFPTRTNLAIASNEDDEDEYADDLQTAILGAYSESPAWSWNSLVSDVSNSTLDADEDGDELYFTFYNWNPTGSIRANGPATYSGGSLTVSSIVGTIPNSGTAYLSSSGTYLGNDIVEFTYTGVTGGNTLTGISGLPNYTTGGGSKRIFFNYGDYVEGFPGNLSSNAYIFPQNHPALEGGTDGAKSKNFIFDILDDVSVNVSCPRVNNTTNGFTFANMSYIHFRGLRSVSSGYYSAHSSLAYKGFVQYLADRINAYRTDNANARTKITSVTVETSSEYTQGIHEALTPTTLRIRFATDQGTLTGANRMYMDWSAPNLAGSRHLLRIGSKRNPEVHDITTLNGGSSRSGGTNIAFESRLDTSDGTGSYSVTNSTRVLTGFEFGNTSLYSNKYWWSGKFNAKYIDINLGAEIASGNTPSPRFSLTDGNFVTDNSYGGFNDNTYNEPVNGGKHAGFFSVEVFTPDVDAKPTRITVLDPNGVSRTTSGTAVAGQSYREIAQVSVSATNAEGIIDNIVSQINGSSADHGFTAAINATKTVMTLTQTTPNYVYQDWEFTIDNQNTPDTLGAAEGSFNMMAVKQFDGYDNYVVPNPLRDLNVADRRQVEAASLTDIEIFGVIYDMPGPIPDYPQIAATTFPSDAIAAVRVKRNSTFTLVGVGTGQWGLGNFTGNLQAATAGINTPATWTNLITATSRFAIRLTNNNETKAVISWMNDGRLGNDRFIITYVDASNWAVWRLTDDEEYLRSYVTGAGGAFETTTMYSSDTYPPKLVSYAGSPGDNITWYFSTNSAGDSNIAITQDESYINLDDFVLIGDGEWQYKPIPDTSEFVTLSTNQTITGEKTFTGDNTFSGETTCSGVSSLTGNVTIGTADGTDNDRHPDTTLTINSEISDQGINFGNHIITDEWLGEIDTLLPPTPHVILNPLPSTVIASGGSTFLPNVPQILPDNRWGIDNFPGISNVPTSYDGFISRGNSLVVDLSSDAQAIRLASFLNNNSVERIIVGRVSSSRWVIFQYFGYNVLREADYMLIPFYPGYVRIINSQGSVITNSDSVTWYFNSSSSVDNTVIDITEVDDDLTLTNDGWVDLPTKQERLVPVRSSTTGSYILNIQDTVNDRYYRGFVRTDLYADGANVFMIRRNQVSGTGSVTTTWASWDGSTTYANAAAVEALTYNNNMPTT